MWAEETIPLGDERSVCGRRAGDGRDIVFIHGALATGHDWAAPAEPLARSHRVTILDRPRHGLSRRPRLEGTPRDQARQILDGLKMLGVDRPLVVAHSYGGLIAL